jgi:hypothetical protein
MRYCTHCGEQAPTEALFCPNCGTRLPTVAAQHNPYYGADTGVPDYGSGQPPVGQPYYAPPARPDGKPTGGSLSLAIISLLFSVLLRPVFAYPVIIYSIYQSTRELKEGLTTRTTARTMSVVALGLAVISHMLGIALSSMGITLGDLIGTLTIGLGLSA